MVHLLSYDCIRCENQRFFFFGTVVSHMDGECWWWTKCAFAERKRITLFDCVQTNSYQRMFHYCSSEVGWGTCGLSRACRYHLELSWIFGYNCLATVMFVVFTPPKVNTAYSNGDLANVARSNPSRQQVAACMAADTACTDTHVYTGKPWYTQNLTQTRMTLRVWMEKWKQATQP